VRNGKVRRGDGRVEDERKGERGEGRKGPNGWFTLPMFEILKNTLHDCYTKNRIRR